MAGIASEISNFVNDVATGVVQAAANIAPKRKVALITGITGQVRILLN